eukprot:TRINITY_DN36228_c0_g1_i1.p1 TRINITY_DN36228_c0_g1~~TRINITY_DN36228_c0_g1_i1.p1  ORF type:complete len:1310 (-),score=241.42 TRINITY_DN36228_c0_g1_i1:136-4065(-)
MCGGMGDVQKQEGLLRKKSHHIGFWKQRFFRLECATLRYWKSERLALQRQAPRGEISLSGCHVLASSGCRFVIKAPLVPYDEELEADSQEQRDAWVCRLNAAALQQRLMASSTGQVSTDRFLQAKGLWQMLQEAVASSAPSTLHTKAEDAVAVTEVALRHVRQGGALVRFCEQPLSPRQGRLVRAGRKMRQKVLQRFQKDEKNVEPVDLDAGSEFWLLLLSSRVISEGSLEASSKVLGASVHVKEPRESPLSFEALHAFADPLDASRPVASLPLLDCEVGEVARCSNGIGWSLRIYEVSEESGCAIGASWTITLETREDCELWRRSARAARWAARAQANGKRRAAEEALAAFDAGPLEWCEAASRRLRDVAAYAPPPPTLSGPSRMRAWASPRQARLQVNFGGGSMVGGVTGNSSIVSSASSSIAGVGTAFVPPPAPQADAACEAVRRVLTACEDVCGEAEGLLEAAVARRPMRQDAAGAALRCALVPALAIVGRCWSKWSGDLPHGQARDLLRWLEARRLVFRNLGLVCPPLDAALPGLASELSLRMGAHLRKMAEELLVAELGERLRQNSNHRNTSSSMYSRRSSFDSVTSVASLASSPMASSLSAGALHSYTVSPLPVDFFTFVNSCLHLDVFQGVPEFHRCRLRTAKFVIREVQESLWGWLQATLPEVPRDWRPRPGAPDALPTVLRRWFWGVTSLANAMPAFISQCQELAANSLVADDDSEEVEDQGVEGEEGANTGKASRCFDLPELGQDPLPIEWRLKLEERGFESILEAFLWAACDVALGRWRRHVLEPSASEAVQMDSQSLVPLLSEHLSASLHVLRSWLEPSLFEQLLMKLFLVCLGSYVLKLSRGSWLQAMQREDTIAYLSEEAVSLCEYFAELSQKPRGASEDVCLWDTGRVIVLFHAVLPAARQIGQRRSGSAQQPRQPAQRRAPLPLEWSGPLGFEDGLSKLVSVLSDGPLPIQDVLAWFSVPGVPCAAAFQELPPLVPAGGLYVAPDSSADAESNRRPSKNLSSAASALLASLPGSAHRDRDSSCASSQGSDHLGRRRHSTGGVSFFGQARDPSSGSRSDNRHGRPKSMSMAEETALLAARNSLAVGLASEGAVCDLRVEPVGAYGAFCDVSVGCEDTQLTEQSWRSTAKRRWVQLAKESPSSGPVFQLLASQPRSLKAAACAELLVSLPLQRLREVTLTGAASMEVAFAEPEGSEAARSSLVRYALDFDCPSHVFRMRLVLEKWWGLQPIKERCPVVVYVADQGFPSITGANLLSDELEQESWRSLSAPLGLKVLQNRLGGLWRDVRKRLEAP